MHLFSIEGMIYYGISLVFVKVFHELGHAFTSKRYGAKIPSMGVAFLVMFPVLYTDTTNAYALQSKYKRLRIAIAGMKVELYLALIATFLWSFLPEGALKSIAFIVATTSWITSLLVNISPFLRFDGYYALSDYTNEKNLQPRSFAYAKWFIRYYILGLDSNPPENLSSAKKKFFIIYAIGTWIYRFFLFLGIAFLVYYFAFKVLGIILFLVEIIYFILAPVYKELKIWWEKRSEVSFNKRNKISLIIHLFIVFLIIIPWNTKVSMEAVLEAINYNEVYSSKPGQIDHIYIENNQSVKKGDLLIKIKSAELEYYISKTKLELENLNVSLQRSTANKEILADIFVLKETIIKKQNELDGFIKLQKTLDLKAPFDGVVLFNNKFKVGQYVNQKEVIVTIQDPASLRVIAFCSSDKTKYIKDNAEAKFIANSVDIKTLVTSVKNISTISTLYLEYPELSSQYNGNIAVRQSQDKQLLTEDANFKVESYPVSNQLNIKNRVDGVLIVNGESSSFLTSSINGLYNILIKESGF